MRALPRSLSLAARGIARTPATFANQVGGRYDSENERPDTPERIGQTR